MIDEWFEAKTRGLTDLAKAQLKRRWGTMQKVLSSQSRLEQIVADILMDMETRDRLKSGRGNAMLVSGSVHEMAHLFARHHDDRFLAIMNRHLPQWERYRDELNSAPLSHERWRLLRSGS